MTRISLVIIILAIGSKGFSQTATDSLFISQIGQLQMKVADKCFKREFFLSNNSTPYDTTKDYFRIGTDYNQFLCGQFINWTDFKIRSKYGSIETDITKKNEYTCFISTPIFNSSKTKCRLLMNTHFSEWGGHTSYYYYKRKGKKWKLVKSSLISIS